LVSEAKAGRSVVRLKGGDPYVFGRGAEEALELYEAGVPFEVVPGVTSAIAAASAAGIPLTHRDMASQVGILTGHENPLKTSSSLDFGALARLGTLAVVMGAGNLENILSRLTAAGKDPKTPASLIQWGATPRQRVATGSIESLPEAAREKGLSAPALLVVGQVASLRDKLNWFEKRPLFGKRILVTRAREQAGRLSAALRELGAEVMERPAIEIRPISPNPELSEALGRLSGYRYLILTSPNGANIFMRATLDRGLDSRALHGLKIAVIGPGTAEALLPFGLRADLLPQEYLAEGLVKLFSGLPPGKTLLARAKEARDTLIKGLNTLRFDLDIVPLYETVTADWPGFEKYSFNGYNIESSFKNKPSTDLIYIDLATLTSASVARGLASKIPERDRAKVPVVSIGPITTQTAKDLGFKVVLEARRATIESLVEATTSYLAQGCQA
jgi:uroporphyrinogen III methyltransferase/synthase